MAVNMDKLMIIDGNSILNRAFYGLSGRQMLSTADGLFTNGVYGFINILNKFLGEENPQYICVAFDLKAPTFRHKEFEGYKAQRKGMPPELAMQMPIMKEVLDAMNIKRLEQEGFEADDILGSLSKLAEEKGLEAIVITGDRDALQLASKITRIKIPTTRGGKTETEEYDIQAVIDKYGVTPTQFIDVKGLMGDTSDNIPGVAGVGEKTALSLIQEYGSIENIYENIDNIDKKALKEKLINGKDMAFQSKRLATIFRDMELQYQIEDLKRQKPHNDKLLELFKRLEFKTLITKFALTETTENKITAEAESEEKVQTAMELEIISDITKLKQFCPILKKHSEAAIQPLFDKIGTFEKQLVGLAFVIDKVKCFYVDVLEIGEEETLNALSDYFSCKENNKYLHDAKSVHVYMMQKNRVIEGIAFDTLIAAYLEDPSNSSYSLSRLSEQYLSREMSTMEDLLGKGKSTVRYSTVDTDKISQYAMNGALAIWELQEIFSVKIEESQQHGLYYEIELPLTEVLASMEYHGFRVNVNDLISFSHRLNEKIVLFEAKILELADEKFNINSPKQLGAILFEKLQLPVKKKTKTGYSTDIEVLEELRDQHEIIENIIEYRQLTKLKSTYVEGLMAVINPNTGKIHSSFNQTIAITGRISSTEPNLQNIPIKLEMGREIRKVFVPTNENYVLLDADYSQIELRVLAHIADDENMIMAFTNKEDIHTSTAAKVFGVSLEEVTPKMRSNAKAVNFGIVYGIGDFSLSKDLGVTRKEARIYIDSYLDRYPGVRNYMKSIVEEGKEKGFVTTLFNRRRYLPELKSSNFNIRSFGERIAMNTPIQGSAADIIKIAMVKVYNQLREGGYKSRLILQVHDELIIETIKEEEQEISRILRDCMESAVLLKAPLIAEVNSGSNWYESK